MQQVLLIGVNGFLGHYLTPLLLSKGFQVIGLGRGPCRLSISSTNFLYQDIDLTNNERLVSVLELYTPDIIIHAAANSKPDDCESDKEQAFRTNVLTTQYLLAFANQYKSFFIYISTDFVFNGKTGMYKENDLTDPVNYYGKTKQLSENLVSKYLGSFAIIRTVLVYGEPLQGRENILSIVFKKLSQGQSFKLINDQYRTPTFVKDLAWGIAEIAENKKQGIWHLSGEGMQTPYEMGLTLAKLYQLDANLLIPVTQESFQEIALRPRTTGLNIEKAKTELGYNPTPFIIALKSIFQ